MKSRLVTILAIAFTLFSLVCVSAETLSTPVYTDFSLGDWFNHYFNTGKFSVVGDAQKCGEDGVGNPTWELAVSGGDTLTVNTANECPSGHGLIDVFVGNSWVPWLEFKDTVSVLCSSGNTQCNAQIYCCPHPEPTSTSQCQQWNGQYSTIKTASCSSWDPSGPSGPGYKCVTDYGTENSIPYDFPSFKYCTESTSFDCYYYSGSGSSCTKKSYPSSYGSCSQIYSYQGALLYSSRSACESNIEEQPSCGDGVCNNGETCSSCLTDCGSCNDGGNGNGEGNGDGETITCGDGVCSLGERFSGSCMQDCEKNVYGTFQVYDLSYGDSAGNPITDKLTPGQSIKVSFKVRSETARTDQYLVEVGVIPYSTAVAWDMDKESGYYSLFAIGEEQKDSCCVGQSNFADNKASLSTGIWSSASVRDFSFDVRVPDSSTKDLCGSEKYWDNSSSKYVIYAIIKNGCFKDGYRKNVYSATTVLLDYAANESTEGTKCNYDYECANGEQCLDAPGWFTGKTCQYTGISGSSFGNLKKVSLTKDQIETATTQDLITSACLASDECLEVEGSSVSCVKLNSLKEEGLITSSNEKEFFDYFSSLKIGTSAFVGGTALYVCAASGVVTAGASLIACGIGGAAATLGLITVGDEGLSKIGESISGIFSKDDELTKAIKEGDSNKVGICTVDDSLNIGAFIDDIGKKINITGNETLDGFLVLGGGLFILFLILNSIGSKR